MCFISYISVTTNFHVNPTYLNMTALQGSNCSYWIVEINQTVVACNKTFSPRSAWFKTYFFSEDHHSATNSLIMILVISIVGSILLTFVLVIYILVSISSKIGKRQQVKQTIIV